MEPENKIELRRAIFLDRDGVINEDHEYVGEPERFHIYPFVGEALKILTKKGYLLFIVTNQSGIGRGYFTEEAMHHLHGILAQEMKSYGVEFTEIYFSPYHPDTPNDIRKPSPKLVLEAARKYGLDLSRSFVIGDSPVDMEMARRAGCSAVLVRTGKGIKTEKLPGQSFDLAFDHLLDAAKAIADDGKLI